MKVSLIKKMHTLSEEYFLMASIVRVTIAPQGKELHCGDVQVLSAIYCLQ